MMYFRLTSTHKNEEGQVFHFSILRTTVIITAKSKDLTLMPTGSDTYTYDANGNMTGGAGRSFTYDYDNRAESITKDGAATVNFYDASGQRVKKVTPMYTTIYIGKHYECTNGVCTKYIFAGSERIASIEGANTRYYHSDHLGSSSVITDQNGNNVQSIYYYPYGEIHTNTGSDVARHKFTGQEYDAETGLYYYNARYYDPKLARFITADTIVPDPMNPQALNRYSYCNNNPVNYIDPSGHGWKKFWKKVAAVVEIVVGAVLTYVGAGSPVSVLGVALMADGVRRLGGNVNVSAQTQVAEFGGGGPGGSPEINYTGPGSGGSGYGNGGGGSGGPIGGGGGNGFYATDESGITIPMVFYARISNFSSSYNNADASRDSINRDMYPSRSRDNATNEREIPKGPESPVTRIAQGAAFGFMATGIATLEVGKIVVLDVAKVLITSKIPSTHSGGFAIDKSFTALEVTKNVAGDFREIGERVGRRIENLRQWWYEK